MRRVATVSDVKVIGRRGWGANPRSLSRFRMRLPATITAIHHTVTATLRIWARRRREVAEMKRIEAIGMDRFGIISYSYLIFRSGHIYTGQGLRVGAHTGGRNSTTIGIAFAGNYEGQRPSLLQLFRAGQLVRRLRRQGHVTHGRAGIRPHQHFKATLCPGRFVLARFNAIKRGGYARWRAVADRRGKRRRVRFFWRHRPAQRWANTMRRRGWTARVIDTGGS